MCALAGHTTPLKAPIMWVSATKLDAILVGCHNVTVVRCHTGLDDGKAAIVQGQLVGGEYVYIKIGFSESCMLANEYTMLNAALPLCPRPMAFSPWATKSILMQLPACKVAMESAVLLADGGTYLTVLVTPAHGVDTFADYLASGPGEAAICGVLHRCIGAINVLNAAGVHHQDMHCRNIVLRDHDMAPILIDFEFAVGAHGCRSLLAYRQDNVADGIATRPHAHCDVYKLAYDVWLRAGSPPKGVLVDAVSEAMRMHPAEATSITLPPVDIPRTRCV